MTAAMKAETPTPSSESHQPSYHRAVTTDEEAQTETASAASSSANLKKKEESEEDDTKEKKPPSAPPSLTRILKVAQPEWPALILAVLLMVGAEGIQLVNPIVIARAYDALVEEDLTEDERKSEINKTMLLVLILHMSGVVSGFFRQAILGSVGERLVARLRNQLYGAILKQEIAFFDEHKSGELVSRLGSDTTLLQTATSQSIPQFVLGIVKLFVSVGLMFWISLKLAGLTIGGVFVIFIIAVPFGKVIGRLAKSYQDQLSVAQTRSTESLQAMRTVQCFAAEERERQRYMSKIGDPDKYKCWWPTKDKNSESKGGSEEDGKSTYSVGFIKAIWNSAFYSFIFGFGFLAMYGSLWFGFHLVTTGEISLGELTAFQSYIFQIGFGLASTSSHLTRVLEALGASGRIFYLMDRVPAIPTPPVETKGSKQGKSNKKQHQQPQQHLRPEKMEGAIEIENISFSYPARPDVPVLQNFSLSIQPNTTVALVGSSGGGKSTVVSLLQRFYDVDSGSIMIDGNDIRSLDLAWLRQHIGYVQQEPQMFGLTVKENICYGVTDREVSQEEIEQVCREANAHDFIMKWPKKYETLVGERGIQLSGGQKQRIAIARALLVNPRLLIFDEATSALDSESEHSVQEAIENVVVGRTVVIVAHRLSTIRDATQIVVIDNHQIVDVGKHDELLRRCSKYQDLIKRQNVMHKGGGSTVEVEDKESGIKNQDN